MRELENLIGKKFNKLTVIEQAEDYIIPSSGKHARRWKCICECGNYTIATTRDLNKGHVKSCGCLHHEKHRENLVGQRFGRLVVLEELEKRGYHYYWKCICDCGKEHIASTQSLKSGHVQSCGCYKDDVNWKVNNIIRENGIITMELTQGKFAILDEDDYDLVKDYGWVAKENRRTHNWYAEARMRKKNKEDKSVMIKMHQLISGIERPDHIDGNGLNNRRNNLRPATDQENSWNRRIKSDNKSGYKGVYQLKKSKKWESAITKSGITYRLGRFDTPEEAAHAYDAKAKELFGEFAWLNFPEENK